ncbi:MAG TPA: LysR family transcriptional regulator [Pseudonocardia sp.]|jgi:DNA-binding transcriptional LysR family regulator|nr:LysR family transcriptional regulator [Pseudonocardia sp.]
MDFGVRSLRYLVAVVDAGHFGHAAHALYIAPPSLTQQIRKLEQQVGFPLLERDKHPVRPTEEGAEFVEAAREVLAAMDRASAVASSSRRHRNDVITLGFTAGTLVRQVLDDLAARVPRLRVEVVELAWPDQVDAVLQGTVDASFVRGPVLPDPAVELVPIEHEGRVVAVSSRHRFASRDRVHIDELATETQLKIAEELADNAWTRWWHADPRPDGTRPRYGARYHSVTEFLELIACGDSVGIIAPSAARQYARPDVRYVELEGVPISDILLCTRVRPRGHIATVVEVARAVGGEMATGRC